MAAKSKSKPQPVKKIPASSTQAAAPRPKNAPPQLTNMLQPGFWREQWPAALIFMALAFVLYGASLTFGYVLDDQMTIWENAFVQKGFAGLRDIFAYDSFMGFFQKKESLFLLEGGRYRPLSLASFAMEVGIFGKSNASLAHISHFFNILLYGFTGIVLYRILLGFFPLKEGGRWYFSLPFLAALIFVLHPLHSECVANIKGRDEIFALLFSLMALWASLKYCDTRRALFLILSGFFLFLGMMSKENALTFLAVIPLTVWFFAPPQAVKGQISNVFFPLLAATLLFILIRYRALGFMVDHGKAMNDLMNDPFIGMNAGEKSATIFLTLGWYVKLLFYPHPLTHDYYPYHVPKVNWSDWRALLSLLLYVGMGAWALVNFRKRSIPAYSILFWLMTLSIVSNLFVSVGTFMNERFVYMPSVAFCIFAAWMISRKIPEWLKEQPDQPAILTAGLVALIGLGFSLRTLTRVPDWKDKLSLNTSALVASPNSSRAQCFYAVALYEERYKKMQDPLEKLHLLDTIDTHLTRALQINPKYSAAWQMAPGIAGERFISQTELFKQKKGPGPQMDRLFNDFSNALKNAPRNQHVREYIEKFIPYLASEGGNPNKILSFCYNQGYELYFKQLQDPQMAIRLMEAGLKTQWPDERIYRGLAEAYQYIGNTAKAAEMQQKATEAQQMEFN